MVLSKWMSGVAARLAPVAVFFLGAWLALSVSRAGLALWKHAAVGAADGWGRVFGYGVRVDVASLCMLFGIPALLSLLLPRTGVIGRGWRWLLCVWLVLVACVLVFLELATPDFIAEYGLRPNRLFVEYLIYPREVANTLLKGHTVSSVLGIVVVALLAWAGWKLARRLTARELPALGVAPRALALLLVLALMFCGGRGTLGHRPLNPAMVAFSNDPTVNVLPLNSFYSLADAMRQWLKKEDGADKLYGTLPDADVLASVRAGTGLPASAFTDAQIPTLAARAPTYTGTPKNVVILLEESLGAQFIGSLGGLPLSPNYDRLSQQGWAFTRLYATGTRSVRGIEAVVAGFAPTPAEAVVKRSNSQSGFFTLAALLKRHGYDTTFYYGGESHFDNMRGFFLGNGFQRVIEQKDFEHPAFTGSWGVSDEDLFARANSEFAKLHAQGKPFFGLMFSSSNHDPFEFPEGRVTPYEQPKQTRNNAAQYADYAIGQFFKQAMASDYWKDTVFVVVADHDSRVFGEDLVPVGNFHIPALILGGGIAPKQDGRVASQIDLPPTLLSLAGIGDATPMSGRDLSNPSLQLPGRALMQYDRNFGYMQGNDVVVLQPGKPPSQYRYDETSKRLQPEALSPELARTAHAQALWGTLAYDRGWYRLPDAK